MEGKTLTGLSRWNHHCVHNSSKISPHSWDAQMCSSGKQLIYITFFCNKCIFLCQVDLRVLSFDVPPQEILSRDSVTVSVEAVIYFRVNNPVVSVTNVNDAQFSTKLLAQTTLRNVLGTRTLSEMLSERDSIANVCYFCAPLHELESCWGGIQCKVIKWHHSCRILSTIFPVKGFILADCISIRWYVSIFQTKWRV